MKGSLRSHRSKNRTEGVVGISLNIVRIFCSNAHRLAQKRCGKVDFVRKLGSHSILGPRSRPAHLDGRFSFFIVLYHISLWSSLTSIIISLVIALLFKLNVTARPVPSSLAKTFPGHAVCWHSAGAMTWVSCYQSQWSKSLCKCITRPLGSSSSPLTWSSSSSFCTVAVLRAALECAMLSIPSVGAQARACNNICLCHWFFVDFQLILISLSMIISCLWTSILFVILGHLPFEQTPWAEQRGSHVCTAQFSP